jgi:hypothetical protein
MTRFLILVLVLSGCASTSSPVGEMMALSARGEAACVRNGVLVRGKERCDATR